MLPVLLTCDARTDRGSEARAGLHAQRCGVEAVVLEAQARMGGRVLTARDGPLSAPVDLGASIITGISADAGKGLRADPSAIVARSGLSPAWLASVVRLYALQKNPRDGSSDFMPLSEVTQVLQSSEPQNLNFD